MNQAIQGVHGGGHVVAIRSQPGFVPQPKGLDVGAQLLRQSAPADDEEAGARDFSMNPRRSPEEFALAFPARRLVAPHHSESVIVRLEAPLLALGRRVERPKPPGVNAPMQHPNPGQVADQRRPRPPLGFERVRFIDSLAQHPGGEMRNRNQNVTLAQQKSPAEP